MAEYWLQLAISNLCVSGALALIAYAVHKRWRQPLLAHVLWLFVLVKLVTPPVFTVPLISVSSAAIGVALSTDARESAAASLPRTIEAQVQTVGEEAVLGDLSVANALVFLWALGSFVLAAWSLSRIARFRRILARASRPAQADVQRLAQDLAAQLGLRKAPAIYSSTAMVSPFVWWVGGHTQVVIPGPVIEQFDREHLRMILAHELAHVRRRDHWVRWIEWFACVTFWWNPIAWWARRSLRVTEELACDVLVLNSLRPDRRNYANSLLTVAEFLSTEAIRLPAVASAMHSGGKLEERLMMIISNRLPKTPRWLLSAVFIIGAGVLPLNIGYAQDFNAVERRLGSAVEAGEITLDQAKVMMDALRRSAHYRGGKQGGDLDVRNRRNAEYQRKIEVAKKKADLYRVEAQKKLIELRKQKFGLPRDKPRDKGRDDDALKRRYYEYQREIEVAVKKDKLSHEGAQKKLIELRKKMFGPPRDRLRDKGRDDDALKRRYVEAQRRIESRVNKGELSRKDAEKKLIEIRKKLFADQQPERSRRDRIREDR